MSSIYPRDPVLNQIKHPTAKVSISVIVPVYNSENSLPELIARLAPVLSNLTDQFELIMVNDGSRDRSWEVVQELVVRYQWVRGINLMRNYGQHNALLCGIRNAQYAVIVTMDDDLQHPPEEVPRLLKKLDEGHDVVYGVPESDRHHWWRQWTSRTAKMLMAYSLGIPHVREISAFRAFRAQLREAFANYDNLFVSIDALLAWGTTHFTSVNVHHEKRLTGTSNYTFSKLFSHAFNIITGFSVLPLRIASWLGFLLVLFGLGVFIYVIGDYLMYGSPVAGFPFLTSIITIFSGAQLFVMGIFGEYMARIYFRTLGRPAASIREIIGQEKNIG
jgi:glycosyltransferase involved in cell wall biosynthesis